MINAQDVTDAIVSEVQRLGRCERVNSVEPKSPPSTGLTAAVWAQTLAPLVAESGLDVTTAYLVMNVRLYMGMLAEPQDAIDPLMLTVANELLAAFSSDFTLDGMVDAVDLLGIGGQTLNAQAGYVQIGGPGGGMMRCMTITVPMIKYDAWAQEA